MEHLKVDELLPEYLGTAGIGFAVVQVYNSSKQKDQDSNTVLIFLVVAAVTAAFYAWSNSQFNPILTVAKLFTQEDESWLQAGATIVMQILGALSGVYFGMKYYGIKTLVPDKDTQHFIDTNMFLTIVVDATQTLLLTLLYMELLSSVRYNVIHAAVGIAILYAVLYRITRDTSRSDTNIATRLAISVQTKDTNYFFKSLIGPVIGGALAIGFYKLRDCGYLKIPLTSDKSNCKEVCEEYLREHQTGGGGGE